MCQSRFVLKKEENIIILIFSFSSLKCFTPAGVPFHINSTIDILKLCMGNPHIASKVARYPVLPDDCVPYVRCGCNLCYHHSC